MPRYIPGIPARYRLRLLILPAFRHSPCSIGEDLPSFDVSWIVDVAGLAEKVSPSLQQLCDIGCYGLGGVPGWSLGPGSANM